jgi:hypothetical protein
MTPQAFALLLWISAGLENGLITAITIFLLPASFEDKRQIISAFREHGQRPFVIAFGFLLIVGPIGLAYTVYRLAQVLISYCRSLLLTWKLHLAERQARLAHQALLRNEASRALERIRGGIYARCPSCLRLIEVDTSMSLPHFPLHPDLTTLSPCPSSGKNFVGPLIRGDVVWPEKKKLKKMAAP